MAEQAEVQKIGKYIIKRKLGRGGMGYVYHGYDPYIKRDVAIKIIHPDLAEDTMLVERFKREAQSAGGLRHPNIVIIYDLGEDNNRPFIAMEFLEGTDMEKLIRDKVNLPLEQKLEIIIQVCDGLDYAHKHGIVHRDITPSNIRILDNGLVKIMDFGIAKISSSQFTQTGTLMGKPHYMSPEQVRGESVDGRTDIFALGVCFYEFLTYRKPFPGENTTAVLLKIINDPPEPLSDLHFTFSNKIENIILKALAKDPAERYQTAKEMGDAIRELLPETKATMITSVISDYAQETILTPSHPTKLSEEKAAEISTLPTSHIQPTIPSAQYPIPKTKVSVKPKNFKLIAFITSILVILFLLGFFVYRNSMKPAMPTATSEKINNENAPSKAATSKAASQNKSLSAKSSSTQISEKDINLPTKVPEIKKPELPPAVARIETPAPSYGFVKLNVLPWAKIVKIVNLDTNKIIYPNNLYTPCYLKLEAGNYSILVANNELNEKTTLSLKIKTDEVKTHIHKFPFLNTFQNEDFESNE